jgi:hypothetical protein
MFYFDTDIYLIMFDGTKLSFISHEVCSFLASVGASRVGFDNDHSDGTQAIPRDVKEMKSDNMMS